MICSVQTSCGWGVPYVALDRERDTLTTYHRQADRAACVKKVSNRTRSIDGLPTRATDRFIAGEEIVEAPFTGPWHTKSDQVGSCRSASCTSDERQLVSSS